MVLLTIMPPWGRPSPPIALGYLSQFLAVHGVEHQAQDHNLEIFSQLNPELRDLWQPQRCEDWVQPERFSETLSQLRSQVDRTVEQLASADASIVGFSVNQSNARLSNEVARRLKLRRPSCTVVFGGLGVFIPAERRQFFSEDSVDLFVMGEGEVTLLRVAERLRAGHGLQGMTGALSAPTDEAFIPRPPLALTDSPWPTYNLFDVNRYPGGGSPMPMLLGRGCASRCSFCGDYPFWGKYRSREGSSVAQELEHHIRRWRVNRFEFNDLAINSDLAALEQMCDGIIERGLEIEWTSYATLRKMPEHLLAKLRRSGCTLLRFGMESASPSVLKRMRKPHRAEGAAEALEQMTRHGILANIGLMVGFPQETDEELEETCVFLRNHQTSIHEVEALSVFYMKPLSEVEQHPHRFGVHMCDDPAHRHNYWVGADGSTFEQRFVRAQRLIEVIKSTSIKFDPCNIHGL